MASALSQDLEKLDAIERFIGQKIERLRLEGFQVPPNGGETPTPKPQKVEPRLDGRARFSRTFRRRR